MQVAQRRWSSVLIAGSALAPKGVCARAWLSQAFTLGLIPLAPFAIGFAKVWPLYDVFRGDPRFDALIARLRLPR